MALPRAPGGASRWWRKQRMFPRRRTSVTTIPIGELPDAHLIADSEEDGERQPLRAGAGTADGTAGAATGAAVGVAAGAAPAGA
eukprot:1199838-Prymnesium_polylepis.1